MKAFPSFVVSTFAVILVGSAMALAAGNAPKKEVAAAASGESSEPVSMARPNALSVELLGRGLLYSINYDRSVTSFLGVGLGFSYIPVSSTTTTSATATTSTSTLSLFTIPLYVNLYSSPDTNRFYATAGLDVVAVSGSFGSIGGIGGSGVAGIFGAGYEYRSEGGFLFRALPYILVGSGGASAWFGLSFGSTF